MADKIPRGRESEFSGKSGSVHKTGSGLGTGPVGSQGGYNGRPGTGSGGNRASTTSAAGSVGATLATSVLTSLLSTKKGRRILLVLAAIVLVFIIIRACSGGGVTSLIQSDTLSSFTSSSGTSSGWTRTANTGTLNSSVASGAREKYTDLKGDGTDKVTVMVYMCGTDLESRSKMGTSDLREMAKATLTNPNLNLLVYTGGCSNWQTSGISNTTTQIWKVSSGQISCVEKDMGNVSMTSPSTLSKYIKYCAANYPANRNILIFWDHGGGSLSGYGYDEKFQSSSSMDLSKINTALSDGGVKFDFIGFDACLMATAENAIMLTKYADYLIASEEVEPGVGWYYTDWLNALNSNTSISTLELGKLIIDTYTDFCAQNLSSSQTTLSLVDLAELEATIPSGISNFATSTSNLIENDGYTTVSDARSSSREFSPSSKIDQVDLVDLAGRMGTDEGEKLAQIILSAVKYNRTSYSMTNSYGLSIYFPYRKASKVDTAVAEYNAIGIDSEYSKCISSFAGYSVAGQVSTGGSTTALGSLLGNFSSSSSSSSSISSLLSSFIGGSSGISITDLTGKNLGFMSSIDINKAANYISQNQLSASDFAFQTYNGHKYIGLSDEKWKLVQDIELNVFVDDGEGYIDLGLDNAYKIENGMLLGEYDGTWLAIDDNIVAYYHIYTLDDGKNYSITGRVPCLLNGNRADLIIVFDNAHKYGVVKGVSYSYANGETETAAKTVDIYDNSFVSDESSVESALKAGDEIVFLADYYSYTGKYLDSYEINRMTVGADSTLTVSNIRITDTTSAVYRFTDVYGQHFWSDEMD